MLSGRGKRIEAPSWASGWPRGADSARAFWLLLNLADAEVTHGWLNSRAITTIGFVG